MSGRGLKRDASRCQRMAELYRNGMTLQEIGTAFNISRERVRQIVKREGVTADEGGTHIRSVRLQMQRDAAKLARANVRTLGTFGCDYPTLLALNDGKRGQAKGSRALAYFRQRHLAKYRGIEWRITFPEWCRLWDESGKWEQRGRGRFGYVMARKNDFGPYAVWNVYITTQAQNVSDYQAELKRRGVECKDGYKRLPERAAELGIAA